MIEDGLKLTAYAGERARVGRHFAADALMALFARHELAVSLLLRGAEGFGAGGRVRTDRLLSLSEDLPVVAVAVDGRPAVEAAFEELAALPAPGLVTLERARLVRDGLETVATPEALHEATKLTVYAGRHERADGGRAHEAVVALLHQTGVAGATVLLGVDGTVHGRRERAAFVGRNARVPLMIVAVGAGDRIAAALPALGALVPRALVTLERVRVCKRDGVRSAEPEPPRIAGAWQKLTVYAGEQSRHRGAALAPQLVRALRAAGAAGATSVRGIWGYHGAHAPHGDILLQLRRRVPVVTVVLDTPERSRKWFEIVDAHTDEAGLVTSEPVPVVRPLGRRQAADSPPAHRPRR